jgi:hypothetical protein
MHYMGRTTIAGDEHNSRTEFQWARIRRLRLLLGLQILRFLPELVGLVGLTQLVG